MTRLTALLICCLLLTGCSPGTSPYHSTDITGANFARTFALRDSNGSPRTLQDFRGKLVTVFFGYIRCPDVCPTNLLTMAEVMRLLGPDADKVQVIFVTIDPERDTPELLAQYVPAFDERFIGLYGDRAQTAATAKEFRILYRKSGNTDGDNYTVDHSAGTYIFDTAGKVRLYVKHGESAANIADDLKKLLNE